MARLVFRVDETKTGVPLELPITRNPLPRIGPQPNCTLEAVDPGAPQHLTAVFVRIIDRYEMFRSAIHDPGNPVVMIQGGPGGDPCHPAAP